MLNPSLGNHDPSVHKDGYLSELRLLPQQTPEHEEAIQRYHRSYVYVLHANTRGDIMQIFVEYCIEEVLYVHFDNLCLLYSSCEYNC